jgi:hypothetical protein
MILSALKKKRQLAPLKEPIDEYYHKLQFILNANKYSKMRPLQIIQNQSLTPY